jgi:hypothetical protein
LLEHGDDTDDEIVMRLVNTPSKVYSSDAEHEASVTVVTPPLGL